MVDKQAKRGTGRGINTSGINIITQRRYHLARKKNFDPLGGSLNYDKPMKAKRNNDILGSKGYSGSSSIYDEESYMPVSGGNTDALMPSGESEKPKKKGLFAGIFGQKKKPVKSVPKDEADHKSDDEILACEETLTADTGDQYEEPLENREDDLFEEEPLTVEEKITTEPVIEHICPPAEKIPAPITEIPSAEKKERTKPVHSQPEQTQASQKKTLRYHPNVCYLCGETSPSPLQQFAFGGKSDPEDSVPLCKTCLRAVKTLMKYRDPADEKEIKSEWRYLAPGLDETRAENIISEGRKNYQ